MPGIARDTLDRCFAKFAASLPVANKTKAVAEAIRQQAQANLAELGRNCPDKQKLAAEVVVRPGAKPGQWLIIGPGEYGRRLEFGTKNSPERPWLIPALVQLWTRCRG